MYKIKLLNEISHKIYGPLDQGAYEIGMKVENPDAIIVRSAAMHDMARNPELLAIARAGAGYNNIPVDACSSDGIVVFNTPGANANGVKELVIAGMLLACRDVVGGIEWARTLKGKGDEVPKLVEKGKGQFVGPELQGKTLGVIGLGAVGALVANAGRALNMEVYGYDPFLSVEHAWMLSRSIHKASDQSAMVHNADFVSIHVPAMDKTRGMVNDEFLSTMRQGAVLLNFSRAELVDPDAIKRALKSGKLAKYVTDFPTEALLDVDGVISIPHLGASTPESEDNCAEMAARQIDDYLSHGAIKNSVNYPDCNPGFTQDVRLTFLHANVPNVVGSIASCLAAAGLNISNMVNKSRGNLAYTVMDIDSDVESDTVDALRKLDNIYRVRVIKV